MIAFSDPSQAPSGAAFTNTQSDTPIPFRSPIRVHVDGNRDTETLGDEIARLSAHLNAATYQLLVLIREFDGREGWGNGFLSCAHWLSWRTGISARPAREKVRVARALAPLDRISEAMASGTLSYSKVRALTRVATPENEKDLLDVARHATAAQLEKLVRAWRRVEDLNDPGKEERRHERRFLRLYQDDDGSYLIQGRLDPEVGAVLEKALEWANETLYRNDSGTAFQNRMADGLGLVAERALAADTPTRDPRPVSRAERFQVVVHVGADELRSRIPSAAASGSAEPQQSKPPRSDSGRQMAAVSGNPGTLEALPPETSRRLSCDAGLVVMTHDAKGDVLDVGRKTRTVPAPLRRALDARDRGCRFPGCECRHTEAHHIQHWAQGGETKLDNLLLLCSRHHRALHEGGFQVRRLAGGGGPQVPRAAGEGGVRVPRAAGEGGVRVQSPAGKGRAQMGESADGDDFQFLSPNGAVIPAVPESRPIQRDPVREIAARNAEAGVVPDAWTATPLWNGDSVDLSLAVDMFRGQRGS